MKNPSYEQALTKSGVDFTYVDEVALDEINHTRGKQMQARLVPLDLNLIDEYRTMLEDGCVPPPLLLWKTGRGLYVPLDGNQRIEAMRTAAKKYQKPFSAYVVTNEDQMVVDRLCWQFNNLVNGRRLSYEECMEHALTMVRKYNQSVKQTARDWGVKDWDLQRKLNTAEMTDLAMANKVDTKHISPSALLHLNPLRKLGDDVAVKAIKVIANNGLGDEAALELAADVSKAKTMDTKLALIDDMAKSAKAMQSRAATKGGKLSHKKGRAPREQLQRLLNQLEEVLDEYQIPAFKPAGKEDRERYSGTSLFIANKLIAIYGLGALLKGQSVA